MAYQQLILMIVTRLFTIKLIITKSARWKTIAINQQTKVTALQYFGFRVNEREKKFKRCQYRT